MTISKLTDDQRSDAVHATIERAATEIAALGLEGVAPWRAMAWIAMDHLRDEACARADLMRLREILASTWPSSSRLSNEMRHDDHNRRDDPDRRFLQSRRWREHIRLRQLAHEPLCRFCRAMGYVKAAEQVDHIIRPRGDRRLQTDPQNFQSLCADHHQAKSLWERRADGKPLQIGAAADGWPIEAPGGTVKV